jgi:hypothetical protein
VASAVAGLRLPWANVRVETVGAAAAPGSTRLAWTYRLDLDEAGRALRAIRLPPGDYRVQMAPGTGWATWRPPGDDVWELVSVPNAALEMTVTLRFRAGLLRVSATQASRQPLGMFNLMVHDVNPPAPGSHRAVAPMVGYLSQDNERWWLEYGHPYRAHLRMEPGALDLLLPPGRYFVKVTKAGFLDPEPEDVILQEGSVLPVSFGLEPAPKEDPK